jgi:hypothetical protein
VNGLTLAAKLQAQEGQLMAMIITFGVITATFITSAIASTVRNVA